MNEGVPKFEDFDSGKEDVALLGRLDRWRGNVVTRLPDGNNSDTAVLVDGELPYVRTENFGCIGGLSAAICDELPGLELGDPSKYAGKFAGFFNEILRIFKFHFRLADDLSDYHNVDVLKREVLPGLEKALQNFLAAESNIVFRKLVETRSAVDDVLRRYVSSDANSPCGYHKDLFRESMDRLRKTYEAYDEVSRYVLELRALVDMAAFKKKGLDALNSQAVSFHYSGTFDFNNHYLDVVNEEISGIMNELKVVMGDIGVVFLSIQRCLADAV
ncbi:hypothetical protein HZC20_00860 [Candidatus Peregrinibacteria bacterium]|nr:hypothetical protein [Candidatus Peregrinibacteria bacterium]